tara:strand:+ start:971 stop:1156 length:186 start_codon:yes stop_codon:yes gene_type:complete
MTRTKNDNREKLDREISIMVQKTLYNKFNKICENEYKTISEKIRELIVKCIKGENNGEKNN